MATTINKATYNKDSLDHFTKDPTTGVTLSYKATLPIATQKNTYIFETDSQNVIYEYQIAVGQKTDYNLGWGFYSTFYLKTCPTSLNWTWLDSTTKMFGTLSATSASDLHNKLVTICEANGVASLADSMFVGRGNFRFNQASTYYGPMIGLKWDPTVSNNNWVAYSGYPDEAQESLRSSHISDNDFDPAQQRCVMVRVRKLKLPQ